MSVDGCLSLCGPVMNCQPVLDVPCLSSSDCSDRSLFSSFVLLYLLILTCLGVSRFRWTACLFRACSTLRWWLPSRQEEMICGFWWWIQKQMPSSAAARFFPLRSTSQVSSNEALCTLYWQQICRSLIHCAHPSFQFSYESRGFCRCASFQPLNSKP